MRRIVCVVVLAASLAACGGRGDDDAGESTSPPPTDSASAAPQDPGAPQDTAPPQPGASDTAATAAPSTHDPAADQALAEAVVLRPEDAPAGWRADPPEPDDDSAYDRRYAECVGVPVEHVDPDFAEAEGQVLSSPEDAEVNSSATVAPSVDGAVPLIAAYRDADTPACFTDVLEDVLVDALAEDGGPGGATVGPPTFERLAYPAIGDETEAFRIGMTVSGNGLTIELFADAILVRSGRVVIESLFMSLFEPFPVADSEHFMRLMTDRVPAGA